MISHAKVISQNQLSSFLVKNDEIEPTPIKPIRVGQIFYIDHLNYVITSMQFNEVSVFGNNCNLPSLLEIPKTIKLNGKVFKVTSIADEAFAECGNLKSVIIPNSIKKIGKFAFIGCENLIKLSIPNSVKYIGRAAFFYCNKLACLISKIENPKEVFYEDFIFSLTPADCDLFIPYGCLSKYKQSVWDNFRRNQEVYIGM